MIRTEWESLVSRGSLYGKRNAPTVVVEFGDYSCGFCRDAQRVLDSLVNRDSIAVVFHYLRREGSDSSAIAAAEASICAAKQDRFVAMHQFLFSSADWRGKPGLDWAVIANRVGVSDTLGFRRCLSDASTLAKIAADSVIARKLGITAIPALFVKERAWEGNADLRAKLADPRR